MSFLDNDSICKKFKIFIDTCSLIEGKFEDFFADIKSDLLKNDNRRGYFFFAKVRLASPQTT